MTHSADTPFEWFREWVNMCAGNWLRHYEVEVEMTVRRTLRVVVPDADVARQAAEARLAMAANGYGELSAVLKWTDGREAYRPMPVEQILPEPAPRILSIAAVD